MRGRSKSSFTFFIICWICHSVYMEASVVLASATSLLLALIELHRAEVIDSLEGLHDLLLLSPKWIPLSSSLPQSQQTISSLSMYNPIAEAYRFCNSSSTHSGAFAVTKCNLYAYFFDRTKQTFRTPGSFMILLTTTAYSPVTVKFDASCFGLLPEVFPHSALKPLK